MDRGDDKNGIQTRIFLNLCLIILNWHSCIVHYRNQTIALDENQVRGIWRGN